MAVYGDKDVAQAAGARRKLWAEGMIRSRGSVEEDLREKLDQLGSAWTVSVDTMQSILEPYREALERRWGCSRTVAHRSRSPYGSLLYETKSFGERGRIIVHVIYRVDVYRRSEHVGMTSMVYHELPSMRSQHGVRFAWCGFKSERGWVFRALLACDETLGGPGRRREMVEGIMSEFRERGG